MPESSAKATPARKTLLALVALVATLCAALCVGALSSTAGYAVPVDTNVDISTYKLTVENTTYTGKSYAGEITVRRSLDDPDVLPETAYTLVFYDEFERACETAPTDAGEYSVAAVGVEAEGYTGRTDNFRLTIAPAEVAKPVAIGGLTFNDKDQAGVKMDSQAPYSLQEGGVATAKDAGEYEATFALDDTKNYVWEGGESPEPISVKWEIARRDISDAEITLVGGVMQYDGKTKIQEFNITLTQGDDLYKPTVKVVDNSDCATTAGTYELTVRGTGNFIGTASTKWVIMGKDLPKDTSFTVEKPKEIVDVLTSERDLATKVLDAEDFSKMAKGEKITLELSAKDVSKSISTDSKSLIENMMPDKNVEYFFDVTISKTTVSTFGVVAVEQVLETNATIDFSVKLPDSLKANKENREFEIVRLHKDSTGKEKADSVDLTYDKENHRVLLKNDKFSEFGVGYKDEAAPSPSPTPAPSSNNGKSTNTAKTGDSALLFVIGGVAIAAAVVCAGVGVVAFRRRRG